jgi:hypothetical protein
MDPCASLGNEFVVVISLLYIGVIRYPVGIGMPKL